MEIIIEKGCGLDVHKETVVACIMGTGIKKEVKTYTTVTSELLRLKKWLQEAGITHVAMESTGVYWKPVFNILEDSFEVILDPVPETDPNQSSEQRNVALEHAGEIFNPRTG